MYKAIRLIENCFTEKELRHQTFEMDSMAGIRAGFNGENVNPQIHILSAGEDNTVKVISAPIARSNGDNIAKMLLVINSLNDKFKFAKFVLEPNGDVVAQCDVPISVSDELIGDVVLELVLVLSRIVDESYPDIMKTIWA
ncbi:YbjN domain-containing protein [Butyrivibrio sp.]|uniref:YbjN domain-containing protein n=1 Tax=Butyrivibrio sp. TaxID=28121 RepID=UPI0025B9E2C8|nr:YbjN domain-containing protein [Butyrivibrio sp.]MBE5838427.1 hypothetical protein [Butyrivibrio sp.]